MFSFTDCFNQHIPVIVPDFCSFISVLYHADLLSCKLEMPLFNILAHGINLLFKIFFKNQFYKKILKKAYVRLIQIWLAWMIRQHETLRPFSERKGNTLFQNSNWNMNEIVFRPSRHLFFFNIWGPGVLWQFTLSYESVFISCSCLSWKFLPVKWMLTLCQCGKRRSLLLNRE